MKDCSKPFTVVVEGNIGCGKTTFLDHFSKHSERVEVLTEPVERWRDVNGHNLLQLMYEDPSRWALPFQSYVQLTMLENHLLATSKPVKLIERSIYSARYCFVENMYRTGKLQGSEFAVLDEWFKFATNKENSLDLKVDLIIYLKTTPEKALERINKRARSEENQIPLQYLQQLHALHEDWLLHKKYPLPAPVLVIDADKNLTEMEDVYRRHEPKVFGGQEVKVEQEVRQSDQLQEAVKAALLSNSTLASAPAAV